MLGSDYIKDGTAIYERSFAIIRAEADLSRFSPDEAEIAIRMIHACGQVEAARHFVFSPGFVAAARAALNAGAPIFCDAEMVAHGVTRARLPAGNEVVCTLRDPRTAEHRRKRSATRAPPPRSNLWGERIAGSLVAIGNAPTALFYLLDKIARRRTEAGGDHRHAGRLRRRGGIEGCAGRDSPSAFPSPSCAAAWAAAP